jgi:hypothetical protein
MICLANSDEFVLKQGGWSENNFYFEVKAKIVFLSEHFAKLVYFWWKTSRRSLQLLSGHLCDVWLAGERSRGSAHLLRTVRPVLSSTVCQRQGRGRRSILLKWAASLDYLGFFCPSSLAIIFLLKIR